LFDDQLREKKLTEFALHISLLLAPTMDYDQTTVGARGPWCWDEAPSSSLGVDAPKAKQSAIAQLIGVCKKKGFNFHQQIPHNYLPPPLIPTKPKKGGVTHGVVIMRH
jgi:hypothetical protein